VRKMGWVGLIVITAGIWAAGEVKATEPRFDNPYQGIFQCHQLTGAANANWVKGGGMQIFWGELQTKDPDTVSDPRDSFDSAKLEELVNALKGEKKRYAQNQLFLAGNVPAGTKIFPDWLKNADGSWKIKFIPGNYGTLYPSVWDSVYKDKVRKFLTTLNLLLTEKGVINNLEYIEGSFGGQWLAPDLWFRDPAIMDKWAEAAGCTPADAKGECSCFGPKWNAAVNEMIDIYEEAFPSVAMMFVKGSSLNYKCNYNGFTSQVAKYGMKLLTKGAGIGHPRHDTCGLNGDFGAWCAGSSRITKCGYEPYAPSAKCASGNDGFTVGNGEPYTCAQNYPSGTPANTDIYMDVYKKALEGHGVSYQCFYTQDIGCGARGAENKYIAEHTGSQISIDQPLPSLPASKNVGEQMSLTFKWTNTGSAPFAAPVKNGLNWKPGSYKLFLEYVDKSRGAVVTQILADNVGSEQMGPGVRTPSSKSTPVTVTIPGTLGSSDGSTRNYRVYAGWVDPNGENKRFALINEETAHDKANRRYLIAENLAVSGVGGAPSGAPSPTVSRVPSSSPSPGPTGMPTITLVPSGPGVTGTSPIPTYGKPAPAVECPKEFSCFEWRGEYRWLGAGYEMKGFGKVRDEECLSRKMGKPEYLGKEKGDANCDGKADGADYSIWRKEAKDMGKTNNRWEADFNQDGAVNDDDLRIWRRSYERWETIEIY
jgi:hypothetical protein